MLLHPPSLTTAARTAVFLVLAYRPPATIAADPDDRCTVRRIDASMSGNRNYYKHQPSQNHAKYFRLTYDRTSKVLWTDNKNSWNKDERVERKYFLRQCGSDLEPDSEDSMYVSNYGPGQFYGGDADRQGIITVPVQNYIVTSTTQIPYLVALDLTDKVRVYIGDPKYVSEPCFADRMNLPNDDPSKIYVIPDTETFGNMTDPSNDQYDEALYERLILDKATVTLGACPIMDKFSGDASQCVVYPNLIDIMGWEEHHPKGRFEYMHLFGALSNTEKQAERLTKRKEGRWNCIDNQIEHWNREIDEDTGAVNIFTNGKLEQTRRVKVAWFAFTGYNDSFDWADPCAGRSGKEESETEDPYYCTMARSCQITLITSEDGDPDPTDIPGNIAKLQQADVVVYSGYFRDLDKSEAGEKVKKALEDTKAWKDLKFYDVTKKGSFTWFEDRVFNYEILLEDFCFVAGRHSKMWKHKVRYLRNVQLEPEGSEGFCLMVPKFKNKESSQKVVSCDYVEYNGLCRRYKMCRTVPGRCANFRSCRNKRKSCRTKLPLVPRGGDGTKSTPAGGRSVVTTCDGLPEKQARLVKFCPKQCGECCDNY